MQGKKKGIRGDIHIMNTEIHLWELYFETMMVALGLHGGGQYLYKKFRYLASWNIKGVIGSKEENFQRLFNHFVVTLPRRPVSNRLQNQVEE